MKRSWMYLFALAPAMAFMPSVAAAPAPGLPVIAILSWDNTSISKDQRDFDGLGKGIMDLLITDLASTGKFRVVDRERIQKVLDEQNLTKAGAIDPQTAVRVGKIFQACYSVYGSFMRDMMGGNTLTAHTTSNETSQYENPQRVQSKGDDIMALIAKLSEQITKDMKLSACPGVAPAPGSGAAPAPTQQSNSNTKSPTPTAAPAKEDVTLYARELPPKEAEKLRKTPVDAKTMLLYSRALDAIDHKDKTKAVELLSQVIAKAPDFGPARDKRAALTKSSP